jgi:hypothetical protein
MPPTTPRSATTYNSTATPRSARRLTTNITGVGTPSRLTVIPPPDFPSLPPLNTKRYPSTPYAEDVELSQHLQQDMDAVDSACEMLSQSTEEMRRQLREHLAHLETERISYENRIRELGEVAKEMVRNQQKEKEEMDKAKENEGEVNRQQQKLKVRLEGYQQEVREALAKLQTRKERKLVFSFLFSSFAISRDSVD